MNLQNNKQTNQQIKQKTDLYIHIGLHKTGTTLIQNIFNGENIYIKIFFNLFSKINTTKLDFQKDNKYMRNASIPKIA